MSVISGVLPIAFVSAVLCEPPLATTLVCVSTLKVQSFSALSVMVRLSAATVLTVPLAVIVLSAARRGAATRASDDQSGCETKHTDASLRVERTHGNPSRPAELLQGTPAWSHQ